MNDGDIIIDLDEAKAILEYMEHGIKDEVKTYSDDDDELLYITHLLRAYQTLKRALAG